MAPGEEVSTTTSAPGQGVGLINNLTIFSGFFNIASHEIDDFNQDILADINKLDFFPKIPQETNFALFLCSLVLAMIWVTYITFFNSRVVGSVFTNLINRFVNIGYVKIGSLSFSVMAGKVMFRDFAYITPDWSVRALDGYLIFRWWRSYVPKDVSKDLSHSDTRLSVQLNGFELHIYNRSHLYKNLEKAFGLEPGIIPEDERDDQTEQEKEDVTDMDTSEYILGKNWRDLIPVIKVDISTGKFVFGNRLLPTTLLISVEEGHFTYSTKPANSNLDHFMHFILCNAENLKVLLAESPKYTGLRLDEAPRNMGDGFVVLASNRVQFYYYMDEPGVVPEREELLTLPSGEMVEPAPPSWGLDIKCGKGTDISYGPWADRQREFLYKFFFPTDYQPLKATPRKVPGDKREATRFDIRLSTLNEATVDILFSKDKETNAIHMNIAQGSYFEMTIPWFIESCSGYCTKLNGNLMKPEATTSLAYRDLLICETLEFEIEMFYPQYWNNRQEWNFTFTVSKASLNFVFAHKWFFQDMIDDWSSRSPPDLLSFVPYTWNFQFIVKEFELLTPANEFNWIDTSSTSPENSHMSICGHLLSVSFALPYTEFLPVNVPFLFNISGENLDLVLHLPDTSSTHHILTTLDTEIKFINRDGNTEWKKEQQEGKWRRRCNYSEGWIDCWWVPNLALSISFLYHPVPMPGPKPQADIGTPEREDSLLGPLRPVDDHVDSPEVEPLKEDIPAFDPESLAPDVCKVDLEVGPSVVFLYGTLIRNFMHVKENLFGEDQKYTPMNEQGLTKEETKPEKEFDPRDYRPLNVTLDITVHDLQANLVKYCAPSEPPCPFLCVEKLVFEMDKSFRETRLQLLLSPVLLKVSDLVERLEKFDSSRLSNAATDSRRRRSSQQTDSRRQSGQTEDPLRPATSQVGGGGGEGNRSSVQADECTRQGNLLLTGLQFRGHAMFSDLDLDLGADTLEYGWLMELNCGNLCGKVTIPQLYSVIMSLETLVYLTVDKENVMKHPRPYKICQHNVRQKECKESHEDVLCPTVSEVKYKMFRASVDLIDINLVEKCTAVRLQCCPLRLSTCNLHGQQTHQGITAIINNIQLHQYISSNVKSNRFDSTHLHHPDLWVEAGSIKIGPVYLEGALAAHILRNTNFQINQHCFLQKHDRRTKKLWFIWPQAVTKVCPSVHGKCACVGGSTFFGLNENGRSFFKPNKTELTSGHNVALMCLRDRRNNPGYGQSILHDNLLLLAANSKLNQQLIEKTLPNSWPAKCFEPPRLPPCGTFKQPRSQNSNPSSGGTDVTPKLLRRQRTIGRKSMTAVTQPPSASSSLRKKRKSLTSSDLKPAAQLPSTPSHSQLSGSSGQPNSCVSEPRSEVSSLVRTDSLVSDAFSFYSLDGDNRTQTLSGSPASPGPVLGSPGPGISSPPLHSHDIDSLRSNSTLRDNLEDIEDRESVDTISRSVSSTSFMSAISEQEDLEVIGQDEFGLVNLHLQVNKPITESPLLMSSYLTHLTQLRCKNIDLKLNTGGLKQKPSFDLTGQLLESLPSYEMLLEGFSCIKMFDKEGEEAFVNRPIPTPSHPQAFTWGEDMFSLDDADTPSDKETLLQSLSDMNTSKSTIIVQFRDSVDIVTSPIMLEGLQRCVESLTPTFEVLHPLAVINHLHSVSLDRVEEKNTLKKEKSLDLQDKVISSDIRPKDKNQRNAPYQSVSRTFEKSVASSVQGSLMLPKINIMVLQASVVEESCAFSALDKVRDITCVSFLALGIKETSFKFHKTSQSKKIVQVLSQNDKLPSSKKRKSKLKRIAQLPVGNIAFESSETQLEEIVLVGSISKIHAQLRRLKNDSSLLKDAAITAIPDHKSRVFFDYSNVPQLSSFGSLSELTSEEEAQARIKDYHPLGFNMCETGLEGVKISVSKKSSNKDKELKDFNEADKVHEENELTKTLSNVTIADTVDLSEADGNSKVLTESVIIESKDKEDSEVKDKEASDTIIDHDESTEVNEPLKDEHHKDEPRKEHHGKKSKASALLQFKTVWFNFAAPPKTPISKKIDFTKLDWNLLSTGSPGIDAWLNPVNRLQNAVSVVLNCYNSRVGAIIASVMAEALEAQELHFAKSSNYEILTALAKTLKEDPSCQLCCVMLRYVKKKGLDEIESNLDFKIIPPLIHLRQGIVVLSRQWKNVIYTPILIEYNMKTSGMKNLYCHDMSVEVSEDIDDTSDEEEGFSDLEMDEEASLLKNAYGRGKLFQEGSIISNLSYFKPRGIRPAGQRSPNSDDILALLENGDRDRKSAVFGGSIYSDDSAAVKSAKSDKILSGPSSPITKLKLGKKVEDDEEDLYHWMRRHQNDQEINPEVKEGNKEPSSQEKSVKIQIENEDKSKLNISNQSAPFHSVGNAFLDAHIIFEPLLSSLGLMPQQITNLSLKNLGSQIVVGGGVDTFQISLIESEFGKEMMKKGKVKLEKIAVDGEGNNSPAFICKKVSLRVNLKKVTDILKGEKETKEKVLPLYVSRNQLKRHTSSFANFTIEIDYISQKVNMPLLRLVNQIVTMHLNAKETNEELREKKQSMMRQEPYRKHKKQSSSGSSASEVGSVLLRPDELSLKGSSINIPLHNPPKPPAATAAVGGGPVGTPSPSNLKSALKQRPKGFASKFRPNSRLGYASLGESPLQDQQQDAFIFSGHPLEKITEEQVTKCWKTIYHLLDLYATLPETKFIDQRSSITQLTNADISLLQRSRMKYAQMMSTDQMKTPETEKSSSKISSPAKKEVSFAKPEFAVKDHFPLIVIGEAKINKVNLMATLSGLKLEGEISGLSSSVNYKERTRGAQKGVIVDAQVNGKVNETTIALLEGSPSHLQTVVKVSVQSSEVNYKTHLAKRDKNDGSIIIGPVNVKIPQHPVTLHGIMTRSSKQLTNTLKEFKGTRILYKGKTTGPEEDIVHGSPKINEHEKLAEKEKAEEQQSQLLKPLVMTFYLQVESFAVSAALLPSLHAQYKMEKVISKGLTGGKAKFSVSLPKHTLSFTTKLGDQIDKDTKLPSEASIDLPKVQVSAEYIQDEMVDGGQEARKAADGSMYSKGNYFKADAEIGELDHGLTTDMLNHLVFVQKVFMKEVNEVVQKMSGGDVLVPVWTEFGDEFELHHTQSSKQLLYTVSVKLKRITVTATTPSNSAVRFETGTSELVLSNRIVNVQGSKSGSNKISTKAKIFLKLSLGQLIKDVIYPEAEPQFQQHAYFKTTIQMRNALEDESVTEEVSTIPDKEVILISLNRPLIFFQPIAVDKAILVWLSYKNAWEYWAEQRSSLNKEVLIATQQVIERVPITQIKEQISSQHSGTLFLQLNVTDIGVAIPMTSDPSSRDMESKGAIVCTVETTSISACSAQSMVSKGKFEDLCIRFYEDFNHTLDDWKPDRNDDNLLNLCTVSEGSYEVCSRTVKATLDERSKMINSNAKWILNIKWQMTGVDVKVDTDIGKHLSALGHTLTTLTGEEDEITEDSSISDDFDSDMIIVDDSVPLRKQRTIQIDNLPDFVFDYSIDPALRAKRMREEMIEQAKTIEDLRKLGASEKTIDAELKKLSDMEAFASKDFRRDIVQKLRRQSARTQSIKEKFGWGGTVTNPAGPPQRGITFKGRSQFPPPLQGEDSLSFEESVRARLESEADSYYGDAPDETDNLFVAVPYSAPARERKKAFYNLKCETIDEDIPPGSPGGSYKEDKRGTTSPKHQMSTHLEKKAAAVSEPNVDYVFDFKIFINYGKCILHTKAEEDPKKMKKDKSGGSFYDSSESPLSQRKFRHNSDRDRNKNKDKSTPLANREIATIFYIPGLDVKVHYTSKTESDFDVSLMSQDSSSRETDVPFLALGKKGTSKKAVLTAWVTLQSIPEETVITPAILEFFEQALEPIPLTKPGLSQDTVNMYDTNADGDEMPVSNLSYPVDVIVYFHMKSNRFRFSCLPVSRVECMLTLPSLDLVFSSKRADETEDANHVYGLKRESSSSNFEEKKKEMAGVGGISVTGCLADFSMHVFHPYGGGRRKRLDTSFSPPAEDRKDSLSVKVAFVKFHLSRSRRMAFDKSNKETGAKIIKQSSDPVGKACVRFSTIVDIGKATFNYDMRRLTEILAFPKAWYRRTLVRRLFLGELKTSNIYMDLESPADAVLEGGLHFTTGHKADQSPTTPHGSLLNARKQSLVGGSQTGTPNLKRPSVAVHSKAKSASPLRKQNSQSWETLVLFAVKFKELEVGMNMGNVMGTVCWISKDFTSEGRLSIGSSGHKDLFIGLGLKGSSLEAKGGIIGGCINLGNIDTYIRVLEDFGKEPKHIVGAKLDAMEVRIDYMGTSVLMGRVSHLEVTVKNEWHVGLDQPNSAEAGTTRKAMVFVCGDLRWDQLQILISKSTTADIIKIYYKLEEFFVQQFKSSKRVLSILEPWSAATPKVMSGVRLGKRSSSSFRSSSSQSVSHHRHWQHVLERISGLKVKNLEIPLPTAGSILGGRLELSGNHISLACFHGINFKAKSWALFSMKEPSISFTSEAQGITLEGDKSTSIEQTMVFSLGMGESLPLAQHYSMATVCKISRNYMYSPQFKTLSEWFSYAFKNSDLDQVDRFPVLGNVEHRPNHRDNSHYNQTLEIIFALPCLTMILKSYHIQGERIPTPDDARPTVTCTCVTEFEDHIYVTVDAEAFFFLHDLISSYVKEKERVLSNQSGGGSNQMNTSHTTDTLTPESEDWRKTKSDTGDHKAEKNGEEKEKSSAVGGFQTDWRNFECPNWKLEPTVRLQSWAGRQIEPYGVDYILQRLGFTHAKTTIPKWLQRGFMDPLDKILSMIVFNAISVVSQEQDGEDELQRRRKVSNILIKSDSFGDQQKKSSPSTRTKQ